MRGTKCLGLALTVCLAGGEASAQTPMREDWTGTGSVGVVASAASRLGERVSVDTYLGYLNGHSDELVYDAGQRVSRLTWSIDNALVVGSRLNLAATDWLSVGVGGWASLASGNTMDDYDWLRTDRDGWSDWSTHPDTSLERAFEIDFSAKARVLERAGFWVDGLAGYQLRNYKWRASGGDYVYSQVGFRDTEGSFDGPVVDYQQWWRTPYLGLAAGYSLSGWRFSGRVIASPFARVADEDHHLANEQRFNGSFDSTKMAAFMLRAEHDLSPGWTLTGEANFQKFWEAKGDMKVSYLFLDDWTSELEDAAGASNETLILSLGLAYQF